MPLPEVSDGGEASLGRMKHRNTGKASLGGFGAAVKQAVGARVLRKGVNDEPYTAGTTLDDPETTNQS
jgi:hypothetical protein